MVEETEWWSRMSRWWRRRRGGARGTAGGGGCSYWCKVRPLFGPPPAGAQLLTPALLFQLLQRSSPLLCLMFEYKWACMEPSRPIIIYIYSFNKSNVKWAYVGPQGSEKLQFVVNAGVKRWKLYVYKEVNISCNTGQEKRVSFFMA